MACRTSFGMWRCHRISLVFSQRQPFSALESIFISVVSALEAEMVFIRNLVGGLLAELEDDINHDKFKRLLHYSRRLTTFQNRVKLVTSYLLPPILPSDCGLMRVWNRSRQPSMKSWNKVGLLRYGTRFEIDAEPYHA
jgi:hypothetical protein